LREGKYRNGYAASDARQVSDLPTQKPLRNSWGLRPINFLVRQSRQVGDLPRIGMAQPWQSVTRKMRVPLLRIDQVVELFSPVLVQILQDDVLLDRPVAIALGQQDLAQIVIGLSEIGLQTDGLPKSFY
jgi:hypothetical protein